MVNDIPQLQGIHVLCADLSVSQQFYTGILGLKNNARKDGKVNLALISQPHGLQLQLLPGALNGKGCKGAGMVSHIGFQVPENSLEHWMDLFEERDIIYNKPMVRFGERYIKFTDPDGMRLELIECKKTPRTDATAQTTIFEVDIQYLSSVTLCQHTPGLIEQLLTQNLGYTLTHTGIQRRKYCRKDLDQSCSIELTDLPNEKQGRTGCGTVSHLSFGIIGGAPAVEEFIAQCSSTALNYTFTQSEQHFAARLEISGFIPLELVDNHSDKDISRSISGKDVKSTIDMGPPDAMHLGISA